MSDFQFTAPDFSGGVGGFLSQVRDELKKVVWPTKKEVVSMTITVILISALVGVYIGILDYSFTSIMTVVLKK